jgi:membrane associated rhomboid family serine protease
MNRSGDAEWAQRSLDELARPAVCLGRFPVVKWLIIINVAVAVIETALSFGGRPNYPEMLGVLNAGKTVFGLQLWRLISYQYLHANAWHLLMNMAALWFMGPLVERSLGSKTFLGLYTLSGVAGGLLFLGIVPLFGMSWDNSLLGASGSVLGVVAAAGMLFPDQIVYLFFALAMKMRTLAIAFAAVFLIFTLTGNLSHAAHLGGMVGGAGWIIVGRRLEGRAGRRSARKAAGAWDRRQREIAREQAEVDRILAKVHEHGIASLSWFEKRSLRKATERQRQRDREADQRFKGVQ